jgi:hypothetical protein
VVGFFDPIKSKSGSGFQSCTILELAEERRFDLVLFCQSHFDLIARINDRISALRRYSEEMFRNF